MSLQHNDTEVCIYDEIFDFDFPDEFIAEENETSHNSPSNEEYVCAGPYRTSHSKKRSTITEPRGKQFMKKAATSSAFQKPALIRDVRPNVSKRSPSTILYAFPNFDKSDSLLYFVHSMTRHVNSGDMEALKRLLLRHADRKCEVSLQENQPPLTARGLLTMSTITAQTQPDMMMCVRATQVIENTICARAYWKYTDVQMIYSSVLPTITDPELHAMFTRKRTRRVRSGLLNGIEKRSPEEQRRLIELVDSDNDVLIYGAVDITLTFDPITKKITRLAFVPKMTSLHPIE